VVSLGEQYFGFTPSTINSRICDAYQYVQETEDRFDIVFFDVCFEQNNNGISPPEKFLSPEYLEKLIQLAPLLVMNTMIRAKKDRENVIKRVKQIGGKHVNKYSAKCVDGDLNEVFMFNSLPLEQPLNEQSRLAQMKTLV
jgi:spermidine synthase